MWGKRQQLKFYLKNYFTGDDKGENDREYYGS